MSKSVLSIIGIFLSLAAVVVFSFISNYNYGNRTEKQIAAQYKNMENILAMYSLKIREAVQVPGMKTDDLVKVTREAMSGRYGDEGSKAVFQWIQENYPGQVSDALYVQIQQMIEAGRDRFENAQTKLIDIKREYETSLGYFWKGIWLKIAGYPRINLDDFKIISSEYATKAFETGTGEPIQLRP